MSSADNARYAGRVAVVTGGASGIGAAIVRRLVAEGASVVAGDISADRLAELERELGDRCHGVAADVTSEADVERLVATAVDRFGGLHAGFNVAGGGGGGSLLEQSEEDWRRVLDLCLTGVFLSMKHEGRALREGGGGAIVNIASLNSTVPMFGGSAYCSAKAGVAMLSQCGALELAEHAIRVNTVSPGLTATPLTAALTELPGATEAYLERIPLKRVGSPEEMAAAALYLGSDDAGYVSGANLFVDGAWATSTYPDLRPFLAQLAPPAAGA
ncbi:SDR family oxidoreductase [Conexibacter sp. JD483]|uniref:SDR family NAD(P)-dependent oxidoreductase n=1 Tax=unclassified Conexibacter TaxID=2627773 RepID=UPI002726A41D|nr:MULTISPECIES: SDR family oxidoreductase [unclassified Conexibacter]MDO8187952.1 SDR family oxidoreductase [Conexibacter sp. CPCC 205706]MDO8200179.1 SDR family oxidoreductase [Conexibacter sp. CPCC 205762]MDR9369725.1 SDR family oxidoreductase [Conexibacter sp. JD483]